jgi:hypothetical protein
MGRMVSGRQVANGSGAGHAGGDPLAAELEAYNRAFAELELPWRWDADTFRQLLSVAGEKDCVAAYIERDHGHLLRAYEKAFLRDLVLDARDRCREDAAC